MLLTEIKLLVPFKVTPATPPVPPLNTIELAPAKPMTLLLSVTALGRISAVLAG